ncbi:MAG: hypothetical protein WCK17_06980 [Verrucomicrobiota bacterium]
MVILWLDRQTLPVGLACGHVRQRPSNLAGKSFLDFLFLAYASQPILPSHLFVMRIAKLPALIDSGSRHHACTSRSANELQTKIVEIRQKRAAGDRSPAKIIIEDGTYRFDAPIVLEPSDSNIAFVAKQGATPIFEGGERISGWKVDASGAWSTQIDPAWKFEALWVNGKRATRARTPNKGFFQATSQPTVPVENIPLAGDPQKTLIAIAPENAASLGFLSPEEQTEVQALIYHSWDVSRLRVAGVQASDGKIQFTGSGREFFSSEAAPRLRLENYLGAMDEPGEWFLEKSGVLHYLPHPGETPETATVTAPKATQWIVLKGEVEKEIFVETSFSAGLNSSSSSGSRPKLEFMPVR